MELSKVNKKKDVGQSVTRETTEYRTDFPITRRQLLVNDERRKPTEAEKKVFD